MKNDDIKPKNNALMGYLFGFLFSLILTGIAYVMVREHMLPSSELGPFITKLAVLQIAVQLFFFLHLGQEGRPRWRIVIFGGMLVVLLILVGGTLWIMDNLNYNMMPHDIDASIIKDEGVQP